MALHAQEAEQAKATDVWTNHVSGIQPLIDPKHADLNLPKLLKVNPLFVYDPKVFLEYCSRWKERKSPTADLSVHRAFAIIPLSSNDGVKYWGLPFKEDSNRSEKATKFAEYAIEVNKFVNNKNKSKNFSESLREYGKRSPDKDVKLTEVCGVTEKLNGNELQIATDRNVPAWEYSKILLPGGP